MPSTYTTNLGVEKPGSGEKSGTWGDLVNDNMDIVDRAINGAVSLTLVGATSTLTTSDGTLSDGQNKLLRLSGSPGGTHTITVSPNDAQKIYFVANGSNQSAVFSQGSGANVTVLAGNAAVIYCNGAGAGAAVLNMLDALAMGAVRITGGTIAGITDLAVADGGTGASTAPAALTNLGLTATAAELNILDGVTASAAEINALDGISADTVAFLAAVDNAAARTALGLAPQTSPTDATAGRLLTPGAFGLGEAGIGPLLVAMDATTATSGNYRYSPATTGARPAGVSANGFVSIAKMDAANSFLQLLVDGQNGFMYTRTCLGGVLGSWRLVGADTPALTQLQAEDAASTVFGTASGQRLGQATKVNLNATGSAPIYACRAWVNFNGTGTVAIRASGNVSSITDNGTGDYTVNFATAMPDADYSVVCTPTKGRSDRSSWVYHLQPNAAADILAGSVRLRGGYVSGTADGSYNAAADMPQVSVAIFR